jgi:hypothetical protein
MTAGTSVAECDLDSLRYNAMHTPAVTKTHFVFRRMRIGIYACRIHREIEDVGWVSTVKQHVPVCVAHGMSERLVSHNPP